MLWGIRDITHPANEAKRRTADPAPSFGCTGSPTLLPPSPKSRLRTASAPGVNHRLTGQSHSFPAPLSCAATHSSPTLPGQMP